MFRRLHVDDSDSGLKTPAEGAVREGLTVNRPAEVGDFEVENDHCWWPAWPANVIIGAFFQSLVD